MAPTKRLQYSESSMDAACLAVNNGRSIRAAAKEHSVPHTTLRERLNGRISMRKKSRTVLSSEQEGHLVEWVAETSQRGFGRTREQILTTVQSVLKETGAKTPFKDQKPGRRWLSNFRNRHKTKLSMQTPHMEERNKLTDVRHTDEQTNTNGDEQTDMEMSQQGWDLMKTIDRLLDLSAAGGCAKLVQYRTLVETGTVPTEPDEKYFCNLYKSLMHKSSVEITRGTSGQGPQTFQNLPVPSCWKSIEKKRQTLQPPKMLSSEAFREFKLNQISKKQEEEEKERTSGKKGKNAGGEVKKAIAEKAQQKEKALHNKKGKRKAKKKECLLQKVKTM